MTLTINAFPLGKKAENVYIGSLSKQIILWEKKILATSEPGIPLCPPNYIKNRKVSDLLDTPDPKDEIPTVQIQSLQPLRARVQL